MRIDVPVVFITASDDVSLSEKVTAEGGIRLLRKPFSNADLLEAIEFGAAGQARFRVMKLVSPGGRTEPRSSFADSQWLVELDSTLTKEQGLPPKLFTRRRRPYRCDTGNPQATSRCNDPMAVRAPPHGGAQILTSRDDDEVCRLGVGAKILAFAASLLFAAQVSAQTDPLPSWNDGPAKKAIVEFVQATTTKGSPKFVPPAERIATFDQDGTLWVEQPMYSQVMYCLERVPALVKAKPELAKVEPFKTVMSGNREAMAKLSEQDLFKILAATLTGMSVETFNAEAKKWLERPRTRAGSGRTRSSRICRCRKC